MIIEKIAIGKIKEAPYNPRKDLQPGDPEYQALKNSIDQFGYIDPLVWNKRTGNLIGGHQRLKILRASGFEQVEVSVVDMDEAREKALNLALNRIQGQWDLEKLADMLEELLTQGAFVKDSGFSEKEIDAILNQMEALDLESEGWEEDQAAGGGNMANCPKCGFRFET